ncbi:helix-turn-helix transcriptional regulator [Nocardia farcinica]|uniref:helix-turn-helix transcriptional regulator n=1 Tax=Nocardia farcinica TaxID=37329 RepID=UPI0024560A10|nr:WYL domain-containing protein [Nocardia farcinica]
MRADRLVALVLLLRQRGRLTASELARELEVSTRTVLRDIEALSTAGVPVYAERGRHGGFALLPGFRTELTGLTHDEALALLIAGGRRGAQALGLGSASASAVLKVVDALPAGYRETAVDVAERLLVEPETDLLARRLTGEEVPGGVAEAVRRAVLEGRRLRIRYTAVGERARWRTVDPVGMVVARGQSYLLATREGAERTYRLSRMAQAEVLAEPARRADRVDLDAAWRERAARFRAGGDLVTAVVRTVPGRRKELVDTAVVVGDEQLDGDQLVMEVGFQDARHAEWALWQLAPEAEVLAPLSLRKALRDRAAAVATRHGESARPAVESES